MSSFSINSMSVFMDPTFRPQFSVDGEGELLRIVTEQSRFVIQWEGPLEALALAEALREMATKIEASVKKEVPA